METLKIRVQKEITGKELHEARRIRHDWHAGRDLNLEQEWGFLSELDTILGTNIVTQYEEALANELPDYVDPFRDGHQETNDCPRQNDETAECPICDDLAKMDDNEFAQKHFATILHWVILQGMQCREELNELLRDELDRLYRRLDPSDRALVRQEKKGYAENGKLLEEAWQEKQEKMEEESEGLPDFEDDFDDDDEEYPS